MTMWSLVEAVYVTQLLSGNVIEKLDKLAVEPYELTQIKPQS